MERWEVVPEHPMARACAVHTAWSGGTEPASCTVNFTKNYSFLALYMHISLLPNISVLSPFFCCFAVKFISSQEPDTKPNETTFALSNPYVFNNLNMASLPGPVVFIWDYQ